MISGRDQRSVKRRHGAAVDDVRRLREHAIAVTYIADRSWNISYRQWQYRERWSTRDVRTNAAGARDNDAAGVAITKYGAAQRLL
jgi:hypothetical protein